MNEKSETSRTGRCPSKVPQDCSQVRRIGRPVRAGGGTLIRFSTVVALVVMIVAGAERSAKAATATGSLPVSATVSGGCVIDSTTAMAFGQYNPLSDANLTVTSTMTVRCVKNTGYRTYITGTRAMSEGTDTLAFDVCLTQNYAADGQCMTAYPAGFAAASPQTAPNKNPIAIPLYGIIAKGKDVAPGNYSATLVPTIEW
jgi:spore coat protein U-like protein